jgi:hypothetical protein
MTDERNLIDPVEIGREGGLSRARNMTPAQRSASAKKAAQARWGTKKVRKKGGKKRS